MSSVNVHPEVPVNGAADAANSSACEPGDYAINGTDQMLRLNCTFTPLATLSSLGWLAAH